jgi:hypothetical protein
MNQKEHKEIHLELHKNLDMLLEDFIIHNDKKYIGNTTILELVEWSYQQTLTPIERYNNE